MDGVFRWVAFLPSKMDARIPIANRYFGVFQSGEIKVRGLEARRRDTPRWIGQVQTEMIARLGQARIRSELPQALNAAFEVYQDALAALKAGRVPLELLVINGKVATRSKRTKARPRPCARRGSWSSRMQVRPGPRVRFLFMQGEPDVRAWELSGKVDPHSLDLRKYMELLAKAGGSVLLPFGIAPEVLM